MEREYRDFIKQQHNERDAQLKTSHAGGGDDGGDDGGFGYEEVSSGSEAEGNHNNGGHRRNHDAGGREYHKADRLNKEAETAGAVKEGPYVDPYAQNPDKGDYHPENRPYGWVPQNAGGRTKHGRGPPDAEGFRQYADMTNIYIVKLPDETKAFFSGRRVSALAPGLEAEDKMRLAGDYGLDDAGSSCAKYAL